MLNLTPAPARFARRPTAAHWMLAWALGLGAGCGNVRVEPTPYAATDALADAAVDAQGDDGARDLADASTPEDAADVAAPTDLTQDETAAVADIVEVPDDQTVAVDAAADASAVACATDEACAGLATQPCEKFTCDSGACAAHPLADGTPCGATQCVALAGVAALEGSVCITGACAQTGTPISCDDKVACTKDTCDATGCVHSGDGAACEDANPCTSDACDPQSGCQHLPVVEVCSDGDPCTIGDHCTAGLCVGDGTCSDGDPCTIDLCDAQGGCTHTTSNSGPCDDGDGCTTEDGCKSGKCLGKTKVCAAPGPCQTASCDPGTGACKTASAADGSACDDNNACSTLDACLGGACVGQKNPCDDGNVCTLDTCAAAGGCKHEAKPLPCNLDASVCTEDVCAQGACKAGAAKPCDDANPCTADSCDPIKGCATKPIALGTPCGAGVWCNAGKCVVVPVPAGMAYVPAATFARGCNATVDPQCKADEKPAHAVTVHSFFIGKTEVTAGQYGACVQSGGCSAPTVSGSGDATAGVAGKEQHPVNYVNWSQAQAYCTWTSGARLCTEAEWEIAARGTDGRRYPWGNADPTCEYAVFSGCPDKATHATAASPKGASPYGSFDMAGNVREWVADWYGATAYAESAKVNPAVDPTGPALGTARVLRGGSYLDNAPEVRTSARSFANPATSAASVGIRCCK